MSICAVKSRRASRAKQSHHNSRRHRADFARAAVFEEFARHAWALDQADFQDRKPWEMPQSSPDARFR